MSRVYRALEKAEKERRRKPEEEPFLGIFREDLIPPKEGLNLETIDLYSIVTNRRCMGVTGFDIKFRRWKHKVRLLLSQVLPAQVIASIERAVSRRDHGSDVNRI